MACNWVSIFLKESVVFIPTVKITCYSGKPVHLCLNFQSKQSNCLNTNGNKCFIAFPSHNIAKYYLGKLCKNYVTIQRRKTKSEKMVIEEEEETVEGRQKGKKKF